MATGLPDLAAPSLGTLSGRIQPTSFPEIDGSFAFVIGSEIEGLLAELAVGDLVQLKQSVDFTTLTRVDFSLRFRQPNNPALAAVFLGGHVKYPTGFAGAESVTIAVDGGGGQLVTFDATHQTQQNVIDRINAVVSGFAVDVDPVGGGLRMISGTTGASSDLEVTAGTALGLSATGLYTGHVETGVDPVFRFKAFAGATELFSLIPAKGEEVGFSSRVLRVDALSGSLDLIFQVEVITL